MALRVLRRSRGRSRRSGFDPHLAPLSPLHFFPARRSALQIVLREDEGEEIEVRDLIPFVFVIAEFFDRSIHPASRSIQIFDLLQIRAKALEMAEEQRCQEGHRLCANNCGFFGSPATMDLCSKCYRDLSLKEERASSAKIAVEKSLLASSSSSAPVAPAPSVSPAEASESVRTVAAAADPAAEGRQAAAQHPGRCTACRKRVGLVGFQCRCGATYCGAHRYPEQHGCSFDFRSAGREAIARANPVVKADKLDGRI